MTEWRDGYGVKIADLDARRDFANPGEPLDPLTEQAAFARLRAALELSSKSAVDELVQMAVTYCHADSSGISLEEEGPEGKLRFRWVAVAGSFAAFLHGTTPRFYSPCGTCLDRGVAQRYEVSQPYYSFLGVTAEPILDGLLIPWRSSTQSGTLWVVSHRGRNVFTEADYTLVCKFAAFVAPNVGNLS